MSREPGRGLSTVPSGLVGVAGGAEGPERGKKLLVDVENTARIQGKASLVPQVTIHGTRGAVEGRGDSLPRCQITCLGPERCLFKYRD